MILAMAVLTAVSALAPPATAPAMNERIDAVFSKYRSVTSPVDLKELVESLGTIDAPARATIRRYLFHSDPSLRRLSAELLAHIGDSCPKLVVRLLKDGDGSVRASAERALISFGYPSATVLEEFARDEEPSSTSRVSAIGTLGDIGSPGSIPFLLDELYKWKMGGAVHDKALEALRKIGSPAIPYMFEMIHYQELEKNVYLYLMSFSREEVAEAFNSYLGDESRDLASRLELAGHAEKIVGTKPIIDSWVDVEREALRSLNLSPGTMSQVKEQLNRLEAIQTLGIGYREPITIAEVPDWFEEMEELERRKEGRLRRIERDRQRRKARKSAKSPKKTGYDRKKDMEEALSGMPFDLKDKARDEFENCLRYTHDSWSQECIEETRAELREGYWKEQREEAQERLAEEWKKNPPPWVAEQEKQRMERFKRDMERRSMGW